VADGIAFLTHKAGGDRPDAELGAWWSGVRGLDPDRVLLGAYWVLYPGSPSTRADAFIARLDSQCPGWRLRPFILQVDCEKWRGDPGTVPSRAEIQAFCDRLVQHMPKLRPIVYAPAWVYGDRLAGLGYPLWASSYVDGAGSHRKLYPGDGSSRWGAYSGQTPAILQYTSSATIGGQTTCDANAYRGTLAELTALVAPGWTEDDVAKQDVLDALEEYFTRGTQKDGVSVTSKVGEDTWTQGLPNAFRSSKTYAYVVIDDMAKALLALADKLGLGVDQLAAAIGTVDEQVLAALADAGHSDDQVAAALRAALGDRAAAVGRILAGA
jgi:GH25 family lysozyme M1 (1,4-beta-N-acetylmuramidase)